MHRRIALDISNLKKICNTVEVNNNVIKFQLKGPKDSYYEDGIWNIRIELSKEYPYKSPSVGFLTKIYHPNIDYNSGSICLNVLNQTWTPIYNLSHIFSTFLPQLLLYPNADDPLNQEAALIFKTNLDVFKNNVNENISIYCK